MTMSDPPDYSRSQAILIGTATYQDSRYLPMPAAANSLSGMRQVLTNSDLCGWPEDRVSIVEDPTDMRKLVQTVRRLARSTDGTLLLYFVGHGVLLQRGQLCLALTDTDADDPDITGLEYQWVREALLDSPAHTKIVILDCCYSGRAIETQSSATDIADSTETRGVFTLTASDHIAHVPPPDHQTSATTSFTGELLDLIRAGIPSEPEKLTLGALYVHLRHRLNLRGLPVPNRRGTDTADQFAFTRNAAYAAGRQRSREPYSPIDAGSQMIISPSGVKAALDWALHDTDRWIYKGGTGAYFRALTLPECVMRARRERRALLVRIEIIDPTDEAVCDTYTRIRRSQGKVSAGEEESWTVKQTRTESFATILAACWYRQRYELVDIDVGLSPTMTTLHWDLSASCVIVTNETAPDTAMVAGREGTFYNWSATDLLASLDQARRVPIEQARSVPLSDEPTIREVDKLFEALGLTLPSSFTDQDIIDISREALKTRSAPVGKPFLNEFLQRCFGHRRHIEGRAVLPR